jgi:hypothetical protein
MADEHAYFQAEAEEAFSTIWTPTVQTVPLDNGYGYGVSIELGQCTGPGLQLDDRGGRLARASPETGHRILTIILGAASRRRCGTGQHSLLATGAGVGSAAFSKLASVLRGVGALPATLSGSRMARPSVLGDVSGLPPEAIEAFPAADYMTDAEERMTLTTSLLAARGPDSARVSIVSLAGSPQPTARPSHRIRTLWP